MSKNKRYCQGCEERERKISELERLYDEAVREAERLSALCLDYGQTLRILRKHSSANFWEAREKRQAYDTLGWRR